MNDAIREGDGERLLVCYKLALLYFKSTGHSKYVFSLIKMFYRIKFCRNDAFRLIWGRFVNIHGFLGRNIPNDLHLEHLNGYLKELLRSIRGNLNEKNATRVARALNDVKKLTEELHKAGVFKEIDCRSYHSFSDFNENIFREMDIYKWLKEKERV